MKKLKRLQNKIIERMLRTIVDFLARSSSVKAMFEYYGMPISRIYDVDICFSDLPVSAKTKDKVIYINSKFLEEGKLSEELHYLVHELCHWLQQECDDPYNRVPDKEAEYLDMPSELEAFMYQANFMREFYGDSVAEDYVDDLLDFHKVKGSERAKKREALLLDT